MEQDTTQGTLDKDQKKLKELLNCRDEIENKVTIRVTPAPTSLFGRIMHPIGRLFAHIFRPNTRYEEHNADDKDHETIRQLVDRKIGKVAEGAGIVSASVAEAEEADATLTDEEIETSIAGIIEDTKAEVPKIRDAHKELMKGSESSKKAIQKAVADWGTGTANEVDLSKWFAALPTAYRLVRHALAYAVGNSERMEQKLFYSNAQSVLTKLLNSKMYQDATPPQKQAIAVGLERMGMRSDKSKKYDILWRSWISKETQNKLDEPFPPVKQ